MLLLPEQDLSHLLRHLTPEQCHRFLKALSESLGTFSAQSAPGSSSRPGEKLIHQPLRSHIVTRDNTTSLFMPASNTTSTEIKIVTIPSTGGVVGVINVFSPEGKLMGLLSAAEITAFRTALVTMSLLTRCTSLGKENIIIFGSGRQAEWHARLALLLLGAKGEIKRITFINRGRKRLEYIDREVLAGQLRPLYPDVTMSVLAREGTPDFDERLQSELASSDVLFCCTPSTEPLFPYSYLQPKEEGEGVSKQRFISLIGSYKPHMQEVDTATLLSGGGRIYVDSREACLEESGELITAKVGGEQLVEIGELFVLGKEVETVAVPDGCNVIFKCVGMGIVDLVVGKTLLDIAEELNVGTQVEGF